MNCVAELCWSERNTNKDCSRRQQSKEEGPIFITSLLKVETEIQPSFMFNLGNNKTSALTLIATLHHLTSLDMATNETQKPRPALQV